MLISVRVTKTDIYRSVWMLEAGRVGIIMKYTVDELSELESPTKLHTNSPLPLFPLTLFLDPLVFQRNVKVKIFKCQMFLY